MYGYGNSLYLTTRSIFANSASGGGIDPDAQAFITAAAITNPTQQEAINQLVLDLKGYGVWTKMKAVYPFVGGTASTHKFNLKNPLDTNAAFRLVFNGGWTHSANGALPNGTNAFANSFLTPSAQLSLNSTHISYYSRTNSGTGNCFGAANAGLTNRTLWQFSGATNYVSLYTAPADYFFYNLNSSSLLIANRTANNLSNAWQGGVKRATSTNASVALTTVPIYFGGNNANGTADSFSNAQCAFASIGDGLTDTEATNFYTAVQTFQTTLGRSIGTQTVSDADAQAFVTAANIQDQVEANAVNNLVIGMKADGVWSKMKAIYPFCGGSASSHKFNLKDPRDLDVAFRLTFNGGWTHNSTGVIPNGTNGYANTFLTPSTGLSINNTHLSVYLRSSTGSAIDIGATAATDLQNLFLAQAYFGNFYADSYSSSSRFMLASQTAGQLTITRTATNSFKAFKNSSQIGSTITSTAGTLPTWPVYIGASNRDNTSVVGYSARPISFASIGDGLTDTDVTNLYTRVQNFQTTLNRQV
jgi:hypothetical protein